MALTWMVPATHYHAGYNTPGYLPEVPYERFDTPKGAVDWLAEQINLLNGCQCIEDLLRCADCVTLGDYCEAHTDYTCENCITIAVLTSALVDGDAARGYATYNEADDQVYCLHPCTDKHREEVPLDEPVTIADKPPLVSMTELGTVLAAADEQMQRITELLEPNPWDLGGTTELTDGE